MTTNPMPVSGQCEMELKAHLIDCRNQQLEALGLEMFSALVLKLKPIVDLALVKANHSLEGAYILITSIAEQREDSDLLLPLLSSVLLNVYSSKY